MAVVSPCIPTSRFDTAQCSLPHGDLEPQVIYLDVDRYPGVVPGY